MSPASPQTSTINPTPEPTPVTRTPSVAEAVTNIEPPSQREIIASNRTKLLNYYRKLNAGKKPEEMFKDLIKGGFLKVERRRGKPPALIWL